MALKPHPSVIQSAKKLRKGQTVVVDQGVPLGLGAPFKGHFGRYRAIQG